MASILAVLLASWHLFDPTTGRTYCGRPVPDAAQKADGMPAPNEGKSCESCLRIYARRTETTT